MSKSIAAMVLANAKRQEAEARKEAKRKEEEARRRDKKQREENIKNAKSIIIGEVQEDMDKFLNFLEEWNYITGEKSRGYAFDGCKGLQPSEIAEIAQNLGFNCEVTLGGGFIVSIPMWKKGEKKTIAQLMLYHHQMSLKKNIKELKAEAKVVAEKDCQEALKKLKSGEYTIKHDENEYCIKVVMVPGVKQIPFYGEQVQNIMKARGFENIVLMGGTWLIAIPKNK